jgi:RNA polymerase sigma-70 factor (ECF subfamily)
MPVPPTEQDQMIAEEIQDRRSADLELARRCIGGEREAQRAFFRAHRARVHHVIYRVLGSNRDIDDLIQDAFLEIFRSLPGFRGESQLSTWIDRICVRVARRRFGDREPPRVSTLELVLAEDSAQGPDRRTEAREALRRLYALLDRVEASHRIAFVLHVIDGRSLRDVAEIAEASVVATKLRVWRTRRRIEAAARRDPVLEGFLGARATDDVKGGRS